MRKVLLLSGIFTIVLLTILLSGFTNVGDTVKKAMWQGNSKYGSGAYEEALQAYESGLSVSPDDKSLNFNAAQTAYMLEAYKEAEEYYKKSGDTVEKFLNTGNIFFMLGESLEDNEQKLQCYLQALKTYQDGIVLFPQNVPLKYNYEIVKAKADDILNNMEQENSDQGDNGENQEQDSQNQDESSDGQSQEQDGQEQGESDVGERQNQGESSEEQIQNQEDSQNALEEDSSGQEQDDGQDSGQNAYSQGEDGIEMEIDQEAIERILRMLEIQEEESLKNNQEVVGGKDGKYGW
jgi:Ca-activated chloride channel family protein